MPRHCAGATHLAFVVRAHHGDEDALLVTALTPVRRQDFNFFPCLQEVREQLDLLAVEGQNADLVLLYPAAYKAFRDLVDELRFDTVLDQVSDGRVVSRYSVRVNEDGLAAIAQ